MSSLIIYHGSSEIIEQPLLGKGKEYNDYGRGFYCTESLELAKEWACTEGIDGFANKYELDMKELKACNLSSEEYSILNWLALLMTYRRIRLSTPIMKLGAEWLREHFLVDIESYDVIIGYRADDSYFSFARAFVNNEISLGQLSRAMRLGKLGEQVVLKSSKAFEQLKFITYETANNAIYYSRRKARDEAARLQYIKELDAEALDGIYIRDIIRGEVKLDDIRV